MHVSPKKPEWEGIQVLTVSQVLRMLAEAKISWGFFPPDFPIEDKVSVLEDPANGIWIGAGADGQSAVDDGGSEDDEFVPESEDEEEDEDGEEEDEDEEEEDAPAIAPASRFGALRVDDDDGNESDED
jgi:hypothetical protein